ncbi:hypothetical protein CF326_g7528 [Tilletia indica]|nr:hypothetical protein CF326_g7528 [Tilletia indica]
MLFSFKITHRGTHLSSAVEAHRVDESAAAATQDSDGAAAPSAVCDLEGKTFDDMEAAIQACFAAAAEEGIELHRDPVNGRTLGNIETTAARKLCCAHQNATNPSDQRSVDKSVNPCSATINLRIHQGGPKWRVSKVYWHHDHPQDLSPYQARLRSDLASLEDQRSLIKFLVAGARGKLDGAHVVDVVETRFPKTNLSYYQITRLMDAYKIELANASAAKQEVAALLSWLADKAAEDTCFVYACEVHPETGDVKRLFVSFPSMLRVLQRYADVVIADIPKIRKMRKMHSEVFPLEVFSVIDGSGEFREVAYVIHAKNDREAYEWTLEHLLSIAGRNPSVIVSGQDNAFSNAIRDVTPETYQLQSFENVWSNITRKLKPELGSTWPNFRDAFWAMFKSDSPAAFESQWKQLIRTYPSTAAYLEANQYDSRRSWASAWTRTRFIATMSTVECVEMEEGLEKLLSGPMTSWTDLFQQLWERSEGEGAVSNLRILRKRSTPSERVFRVIVDRLRLECEPWAVRRALDEIEECMLFRARSIPPPNPSLSDPSSAPNQLSGNPGEENGVEQREGEQEVIRSSRIEDDGPGSGNVARRVDEPEEESDELPMDLEDVDIDAKYLSDMLAESGLTVTSAYEVQSMETTARSYVVVCTDGGRFYCPCTEAIAMGVPCRHMWAIILNGEWFHMGLIARRWLQTRKGPISFQPIGVQGVRIDAPPPNVSTATKALSTEHDVYSGLDSFASLTQSQVSYRLMAMLRPAGKVIKTQAQLQRFEKVIGDVVCEMGQEKEKTDVRTVTLSQSKGTSSSSGSTSFNANGKRPLRTPADSQLGSQAGPSGANEGGSAVPAAEVDQSPVAKRAKVVGSRVTPPHGRGPVSAPASGAGAATASSSSQRDSLLVPMGRTQQSSPSKLMIPDRSLSAEFEMSTASDSSESDELADSLLPPPTSQERSTARSIKRTFFSKGRKT